MRFQVSKRTEVIGLVSHISLEWGYLGAYRFVGEWLG